jgi:hypothetical protein
MLKSFSGVSSLILCAVLAVSLPASADDGGEVYVVSSNRDADAYYMSSDGGGTFSSQEILHPGDHPIINVFINWSYANGLGDFDNDGDLDYIMATGMLYKNLYISKKVDAVYVDADDPSAGKVHPFNEPQFAGTFSALGGQFASDFAVADFNGDGFDDFVLPLGNATSSGLVINNSYTDPDTEEVKFQFNPVPLPNTAPLDSTGADAADFNGDGHADFVIASFSEGQFYVSISDGDVDGDGIPAFKTTPINACAGCGGGSGIAAADFNGDGIVDIAVAGSDILDIYVGDTGNVEDGGQINFTHMTDPSDQPIRQLLPSSSSAIDNYNFDGDDYQDLVVASQEGVVVLWGSEGGTFDKWKWTYLGGSDYDLGGSDFRLNAVSAPPWVLIPEPEPENMEPVAVIEPAYLEATAGEKIVFDGSNSFDEDGQIASYEWDFGDGNANAGVMVLSSSIMTLSSTEDAGNTTEGDKPTHVYYDSGIYPVTLVVTDDRGAKSTVQAEVRVAAVPATVRFLPRSLNLKSRGKWITATIKLPEGYNLNEVDPASVSVATKDSDRIFAKPLSRRNFLAKLWRKIQRRYKIVTVRFDRQAVINAIRSPSNETSLNLEGNLLRNDGRRVKFEGSGKIRTYEKKTKWSFWKKYLSKKNSY